MGQPRNFLKKYSKQTNSEDFYFESLEGLRRFE